MKREAAVKELARWAEGFADMLAPGPLSIEVTYMFSSHHRTSSARLPADNSRVIGM
jgi:hypothetical protein